MYTSFMSKTNDLAVRTISIRPTIRMKPIATEYGQWTNKPKNAKFFY